jgi:hypothetical protein
MILISRRGCKSTHSGRSPAGCRVGTTDHCDRGCAQDPADHEHAASGPWLLESPRRAAIPDDLALVSNLKHAASARNEGHFAEIRPEDREEFLGQPSRAQKPLALRAVGDGDPGRVVFIATETHKFQAGVTPADPLMTCIEF